jgi:hypothetical protein
MSDNRPDGLQGPVEVIKAAGPAAGGLAIALYGVWGGQYAAKFKPPIDDFASWVCFAAMIIGLAIATWRAVRPLQRRRN